MKFDTIMMLFMPFILLFLFGMLFGNIHTLDEQRGRVCGGMAQSLYHIGYECCVACEESDMEFVSYEYDTGYFHADVNECHCIDNGTYVQIW